MLDVSKETNVKFLRAATQFLQEKVLFLEKELAQAKLLKRLDEEMCQKLSEELLVLKKRFFVGGSERSASKTTSKKNRKRKPQQELLVHNKRPLEDVPKPCAELDSEEIIHTLPVDGTDSSFASFCFCGSCSPKVMTGAFEESMEIHVTERKYVLRKHKRQKYICRKCGKIAAAKGPQKLMPGAEFSIHMAAQIADDKFHRHIPLNRQAEMMEERGLHVEVKTLYSLTEHLMALMPEVPQMILKEIKGEHHIHIDESPMKLLHPEQNGYVWSVSNACGVFYQYEPTRSGAVAREMLRDFKGCVMADAYKGYDFLEKVESITFVLCWAHARRRFDDAKNVYPLAIAAIDLIDKLYDYDHEAQNYEDLAQIRQEKSSLIIKQLEQWMQNQQGKYLESSLIGSAIGYVNDHWSRLIAFLKDPHVPLDNNTGERAQRQPVMGRNNFFGFRTINGADVAMFYYTLISTCRVLDVTPKAYMIEMAYRSIRGEKIISPYQYGKEITERVKAGESYKSVFASMLQ